MTRVRTLALGGAFLAAASARALSGASADDLSRLEQRGKAIYHGTGGAPSGITARIGVPPAEAPLALLACVSCHGADGKGKPEGRVVPSDITWDALTKPYGVTHTSGRAHPPYSERLLVRAICMGLDPAGHELHATMPRFQMLREDADALIQYLKRLGRDPDPGLSESTITIGTILPASGSAAQAGPAVRALWHAYVDALNTQGGIYGRRVELTDAEIRDAPDGAELDVNKFVSERRPFAILSGVAGGAEHAIADAADRHRTPLVGLQTLLPDTGAAVNPHAFYLLSGVAQQERALLAYARRTGWDDVRTVDLSRDGRTMHATAQALKASNATHVLLIGGGDEMLALANEAVSIGWTPVLLIPGSLASHDVFSMPSALAGRILLALPSLPSDQTTAGNAEYRALADADHLPRHQVAAQIAALCAAKVLTEGLKLAGRSLSRATLVAALEGLTDFDTGQMPRIGFNPNRRIGALGAYIVSVDLVAKQFTQVTEWMSLE